MCSYFQVQLWQFLLELLTDKEHRNVIHWIGDVGEFKLENPEMVAQLWGTRKKQTKHELRKTQQGTQVKTHLSCYWMADLDP